MWWHRAQMRERKAMLQREHCKATLADASLFAVSALIIIVMALGAH